MNSLNYTKSGYGFDLEGLTILYQLCVSYPRRSGLVEKSNDLRPIYLIHFTFTYFDSQGGA
jgi:hypothetical protein